MKKRYLKTVEDVVALKDTDTKIYSEIDKFCELKFINGILCKIDKKTHCVDFNIDIYIDPDNDVFYILEEPMQEATADDINKLCKFWDNDENDFRLSILRSIEIASQTDYPFEDDFDCEWIHCRKLLPSEVAELTGYKVEEK